MKEKSKSILRNIVYPVTAQALSIQHPYLAILAIFIYGANTLIDEWKFKRANEIITNIGEDGIKFFIDGDDKTKDIGHKIFTVLTDEASLEKRKTFYKYLLNYKNGYKVKPDYHTKLVMTINMMTLEELKDFIIFSKNYKKIIDYQRINRDNNEGWPLNTNSKTTLRYIYGSKIFQKYSEDKITDLVESLVNYNLVYVRYGALGGTLYGPTTEFGKILLKYISE